jgi:hypothetical protein
MAKQIDIYIAVATSIFGAVLGLVLSKMFAVEGQLSGNRTSVVQTVSIKTINNHSSSIRNNSQQETELFMLLGGLFVFVGLTLYIFFRTAILTALLYGEIFLLSIWIGAVLRSMAMGRFKGLTWSIYLLYVVVFMISYLFAIMLAFNPIHSPENFQHAEQIINQKGWSGLKNYFLFEDLLWGAMHLMGLCILTYTFWLMAMSLLHIATAGNSLSYGRPDSWIVKKTARYCTPWTNIIFISLLVLLGAAMASGVFLYWIQYEIPFYIKELINIVLYGSR